MEYRKLPNGTPVIEGALEFRIKGFSVLNSKQIDKFKNDFFDIYPKSDELQTVTGEFSVTPTGVHTSTQKSEPNAVILKSKDEKDLLRARLGSLVAIRLEPYEDWEQLTTPILKGLQWLIENAGATYLERIGARMVNRFHVPQGKFDLDEWFKYTANWPDNLNVAHFLTRYTVEHSQKPFVSTVIQTVRGNSPTPELILDIDTFATYEDGLKLIPDESLEQQLVPILSEMRGIKNEMFYKHVTDKALEPYL